MAATALQSAPVLSTPDTHIFEDPTPVVDASSLPRLSDEQVALTYEIERTVREIREGRWKRIALQFPDHMLCDAPRVYEQLHRGLSRSGKPKSSLQETNGETTTEELSTKLENTTIQEEEDNVPERLFILGDTSYGACCVDEVAAEHVDADVVVHYGRSCLSPPSRLPVVYVFTEQLLDLDTVVLTFKETYFDKDTKVVLMADIPYSHHIPTLHARLVTEGYANIFATKIVHKPSSLLPNRTIPPEAEADKAALREYALFHISEPPTSLLLTLSSRVASTHIYSITSTSTSPSASLASTAQALRRRYALLTSLSTTSIFGILINTLSVKNYMHILSHVQTQIAAAGKKHYTFVVGKVNAAKVANFSEVGGWIVIGCWESSLIESKEFWRPMITPWELGVALMGDGERVWTGEWEADYQAILDRERRREVEVEANGSPAENEVNDEQEEANSNADADYDSEEESAPPEFDLRTGRYVSHSRPMHSTTTPRAAVQASVEPSQQAAIPSASTSLTKRASGEIASVGGVASPGAEYLRSQRTWQGLGSDYASEERGQGGEARAARMEEGRRGVARGYVVGEGEERH